MLYYWRWVSRVWLHVVDVKHKRKRKRPKFTVLNSSTTLGWRFFFAILNYCVVAASRNRNGVQLSTVALHFLGDTALNLADVAQIPVVAFFEQDFWFSGNLKRVKHC